MSDPTTNTTTGASLVTEAELDRRIIEPSDFQPDAQAFIDVRLPRSEGKLSYSFIGPGVSQNDEQTVNLDEPHGFNIGAASMPHGVVNNPHLHYTAEVFVCTAGSYDFTIGRGEEQRLAIEEGTVFSVPTWVFRGFVNTGPDDGFLFTVLGHDDTGGIIWSPEILEQAATTGLHLANDYSVVDERRGDVPHDVVEPLRDHELATDGGVDHVSDEELEGRAVRRADRDWSDRALLSSVLSGHSTALAPVIGHGLTESRHQHPPITNPHGFTLEWLRVAPGESTGLHRIDDSQVLLVTEGSLAIEVNEADDRIARTPANGSVVSIPRRSWREFRNVGDDDAIAAVVCGGDARSRIEWSPDIAKAALDAGWALDASGYLAPIHLLGRSAH